DGHAPKRGDAAARSGTSRDTAYSILSRLRAYSVLAMCAFSTAIKRSGSLGVTTRSLCHQPVKSSGTRPWIRLLNVFDPVRLLHAWLPCGMLSCSNGIVLC